LKKKLKSEINNNYKTYIMDCDSDYQTEQNYQQTTQKYDVFNDNDIDANFELFENVLEVSKENLESHLNGLFEKCSVVDLMKFIDEPKNFNVLNEINNLPRHFPLRKDVPKMPHPFPDLNELVSEKLLELRNN
jgi:hypothetical protein